MTPSPEVLELGLFAIVGTAALTGVLSLVGIGKLYDSIGAGGLSLDVPDRPIGPRPGSVAAEQEEVAEIRQLLQAKSALREARGEPPLDVEAELRRRWGEPR